MNKLMAVLMAGVFCVSVAQAEDKKPAEKSAPPAAEKKMGAQQSKMGDCNKEAKAKDLKGDERKKFMSGCLKGGNVAAEAVPAKPAAAAKPADQKQKMGYCNKEAGAKKLKGDERKKFMSECLKG
ncbi:MAG: PsiF repeat-containing protein [Burkholderiales bacterium]|nr:PsiF repeat-containing protein [Burkholderiales bacterium]